jgi:predicted amidohydrolase
MPVVKYIARSATSQPSRSTWLFTKNTLFLQSGTVQKASMASLSTQKSAWNNEEDKANINPIAAIAQLRSTADKFKNLVDVATCARFAKAKGASMLFLPECFGFMGESSSQTLDEAEHPTRLSMGPSASTASRLAIGIKAESSVEINSNELREEELELTRILKSIVHNTGHDYGDTDDHNQDTTIPDGKSPAVSSLMDGLRTIAKESGLWISGGGIHVAGAPPEVDNSTHRVYNTHVILDSSGNLKAQYQKIHLFDVSIPGKVELRESKTTAPGTELIACDSPVGRLGVTICYDLRFPEMYTELTQTMGAQILLVPSAFTVPTGAAHWHALLRGE